MKHTIFIATLAAACFTTAINMGDSYSTSLNQIISDREKSANNIFGSEQTVFGSTTSNPDIEIGMGMDTNTEQNDTIMLYQHANNLIASGEGRCIDFQLYVNDKMNGEGYFSVRSQFANDTLSSKARDMCH